MDVLIFLILSAVAVGTVCHLTGIWSWAVSRTAAHAARGGRWITSPDGATSDLCKELSLREVLRDLLETTGGWFWVAVVVEQPIPTDGQTTEDEWQLRTLLNWIVTAFPSGTRLQTLTKISTDVSAFADVHRRNAERGTDAGARLLEEERGRALLREASRGQVRVSDQIVLIGRRASPVATARGAGLRGYLRFAVAQLKGAFKLSHHLRLSVEEVERVYDELTRERERFVADFERAGGRARVSDMSPVWTRYYERLNPDAGAAGDDAPYYRQHTNPRRLLCQSDVQWTKGGAIKIGNRWTMTLPLRGLPAKSYAGVMEAFTRRINFAEISSWLEVTDDLLKDEALKDREDFIAALDERGHADRDEIKEAEELAGVRQLTREGVERVTTWGFSVYFEADTEKELNKRRRVVQSLLRRCWGLECTPDANPVEAWAAGLPGGCELDYRSADVRSRNAAAFACWTGGAIGLPAEDSLMVFRHADGGLVGYHPDSRRISNSGDELIMGEKGSGKSAYLNFRRSVLFGAGYRQVSFDLNGSATRVCAAAGGVVYRLGDPTCRGFGIFPGWPEREEFTAAEMFDFGMPLAWIADLAEMLAQLATDKARGERSLPLELRGLLHQACEQTYRDGAEARRIPTLDDLLRVLEEWPNTAERGDALLLRRRLQIFKRESIYGQFLNNTDAPPPVTAPYTVFDFQHVLHDPVLALLAGMAASTFVQRFAATDRRIRKSFDMDEQHILLNKVPQLLDVADLTARAARKQGVIIAFATQSPADYERPGLEGIIASGSVQFFFRCADVEAARRVFKLTDGEAEMVRNLGTGESSYRPCVLRTPTFRAPLHLVHNPLDRRLLLGASAQENVEMGELREHFKDIPQTLLTALEMDALGHRAGAEVRG